MLQEFVFNKGFIPAANALMIMHLQFADDIIIFCDVKNKDQIKNIKLILVHFKSKLIGDKNGE